MHHYVCNSRVKALPSCRIHSYSNRLSDPLWFTSRGDKSLSVVFTSIHTNYLNQWERFTCTFAELPAQ